MLIEMGEQQTQNSEQEKGEGGEEEGGKANGEDIAISKRGSIATKAASQAVVWSMVMRLAFVRGWGGESNREIVSFRSCVRAGEARRSCVSEREAMSHW